jgi:hypothetical protein
VRRRTQTCIAVRLRRGRNLVCFRLLRPGQSFVVGPDVAGADFVVPSERRAVRVDRKGCVLLETSGGYQLMPMPAHLDIKLGELDLSIRSAGELPLGRTFAPGIWHFDLGMVAAMAFYVLMITLLAFTVFQDSSFATGSDVDRDRAEARVRQ